MLQKLRLFSLLVVLLFGTAVSSYGGLRYLETKNARIIYADPIHSFIAPHVARCFESAINFHQKHWNHVLAEKVTVVIHDLGDYGNAGAKNIPEDLIVLGLAPLNYTFETMPANERMSSLMNHELVHIYAMDNSSKIDRFFRGSLGGKPVPTPDNPLSILYDYLTSPRRSAPRWYHEGIAVFFETWMAGGYGRALGSYDEMVFRTKVLEDRKFYDQVSLEAEGTKIDFNVGVNSYLYGTRFSTYLASTYGPERLTEWIARTDSSDAYFVSQFKRVFGISLDEAWDDWVVYERKFQQKNLESIRAYPTTEHRDIAPQAFGSMSRAFLDDETGELIAAVNYPGKIAHLTTIDPGSGKTDKITDVVGPALFFVSSVAYDTATGSLFYTTDNYGWRNLRVVNIETHHSTTLINDARIGDLAFNNVDKSIWGIRHFNGISTLVRIPPPYTEWKTIYAWPYGRDIYDIDISPDGTRMSAALAEISGRQHLIMMNLSDLQAGDTSYVSLYDFGISNPEGFVFSPDGGYLYGTSYYTGVSNVFRYDLTLDSMEALSNCETGFFRPIPYTEDSLIVFRFTGDGFVPSIIPIRPIEDINAIQYFGQAVVERYPEVKSWEAAAPSAINLDSLTVEKGEYRALESVKVNSLEPVVEGYKDYAAYGLRFNYADVLSFHEGTATVTFVPNKRIDTSERWHINFMHSYLNWTLSATLNGTDFYDLFGPTKRSRKGYSVGLDYSNTLIQDDPKVLELSVGVTGHGGLEVLPEYQNIATSFDRFVSVSSQLSYEDLQASLGAVDAEKGWSWDLLSGTSHVNEHLYPQFVGQFDYGVPLPIKHSSIWLRTAGGYAYGDREEPLANFYFGGFGNNWVDHLTERRYREFYAFPGTELNEIGGTDFAKVGLEWILPPIRFGRLGYPALYSSWARISLFSTGLLTNIDSPMYESRLMNLGAQVDIRMQLLSNLKLTLSSGYAVAVREKGSLSDEFMISLKIL